MFLEGLTRRQKYNYIHFRGDKKAAASEYSWSLSVPFKIDRRYVLVNIYKVSIKLVFFLSPSSVEIRSPSNRSI